MPHTVPNQKIIHIHRQRPKSNFLQISKENWYAANKDLSPFGLQLYLYIAGNADGYDLALSQAAAEEEAGIKHTTFHKYVDIMIEKGYLVPRQEGSNIYDFYEVPKREEEGKAVPPCGNENLPGDKEKSSNPPCEQICSPSDKEIYNNRDNFKDNDIYEKEFIF